MLKVKETRRITLEAGSNLNRIETRFDWEGGPSEMLAAGGDCYTQGTPTPRCDKSARHLAYWEPEQPGNGMIGCGVIMTTDSEFVSTPDQALLTTAVQRGKPLVYFAGAGWSKSGDFATKEDWFKYLVQPIENSEVEFLWKLDSLPASKNTRP